MDKLTIHDFSDHLFWDVQKQDVDLERNSSFMVQRVLEYGLLEDWQRLKAYYGLARIAQIAQALRSLEPRALSFICALSHTSPKQYRCYTLKQLNPQPWSY